MEALVKRTTLIVRSVENSLKLYQDVIGMSTYYDNEILVSGKGLPAGEPNSMTRLVILKAKDPVVGMIGLLEFTDPAIPDPGPYPKRLTIGGTVFVMSTDDVQAVYAGAQEVPGVHIHGAPFDEEVTGADGSTIKMTSLSFFDPDGYFIEVNQRHN